MTKRTMKTALSCGLAIGLVLAGCARDRKRDRASDAPTLVPLTREASTPAPARGPSRPPAAAGIEIDREHPARGVPDPWSEAVCAVTIGALQRELTGHGHTPGAADGRWGPRTEVAFREFQLGRGLPVTGLPDRLTLESLFAEEAVPIQRVRGTERIAPTPRAPPNDAVSFGGGLGLGLLAAITLLATKRKGGSLEPPLS